MEDGRKKGGRKEEKKEGRQARGENALSVHRLES